MSEEFEKGLAIFADVYGQEAAEGCRKGFESGDDFTALHIKFSMEFPFGQVYHTIMGVANGLTRAEIEEVFFSTIPYCGFPAANTAKAAMNEGFKELEKMGKL
jgi:4-carboxymuconolactone decarboxylase